MAARARNRKGGGKDAAADAAGGSAPAARHGGVGDGANGGGLAAELARMIPRRSATPAADRALVDSDEPAGDDASGAAVALRVTILISVCLMSFLIRLFAVVRWESVIHEFDPYFNYRTTKFLASEGYYAFHDWFDDRGWYPLGRIIGGTIYPGLMVTAAALHGAMNALSVSINVRNMCVFLAPVFASNTALATYWLMHEVTRRASTSLLAAALVGIVPSYISRSVGGSYDNEGVAIFALVFTFFLWVRAVNTGSLKWGAAAALGYFYMVAAWGGYVFIINIIPIYTAVMIVAGRFSARLYVAYSTFYVLGSLLAMQVPFVGFNVLMQAECAASHGVFVLVQATYLYQLLREYGTHPAFSRLVSPEAMHRLKYTALMIAAIGVGAVAAVLVAMQLTGRMQWTGRSLSLLDPTYATKYIPIISSVSEHQPTMWTSFFFDLHVCVPFAPVGLFFLFDKPTDAKIFLILYGTLTWYFAGVMVRLLLTLAPAACMLAAVGISALLNRFMGHLKAWMATRGGLAAPKAPAKPPQDYDASRVAPLFPVLLSGVVVTVATGLLLFYSAHAVFAASEAYSSPSIVLATTQSDGTRVVLDDYREAYYWLRQNTADDAKIMSWWDYGYQMSAMANRTTIVDNNTWNNTHIATVGRAMASSEAKAYPILQSLDVDYVLAIFGGVSGYSSDDINKFLWMVRIGGGVFPDQIQEPQYFTSEGQFRIDEKGSDTLLNCMMYKMCYYRLDELHTDYAHDAGYDRTRDAMVGNKGFDLEHLEEAFTSEHWIVRIYKVRKPANRVEAPSSVSVAKPRRDRSLLPGGGVGASTDGWENVRAKFVGCYASEAAFSADKQYGGGDTGANAGFAQRHGIAHRKRYFAVARAAVDGHAFAFDELHGAPDRFGPDCDRGCLDDQDKRCGCADGGCMDAPPRGEAIRRAWAVYELPKADGASSKSRRGRGGNGDGKSKGRPAYKGMQASRRAQSGAGAGKVRGKGKGKGKGRGKGKGSRRGGQRGTA